MPVSLSEWRVRTGRFIHWTREYIERERKEKLLRERTRRIKVLCERLLEKKRKCGETDHDDIQEASTELDSSLVELLSETDSKIQDLLSQDDEEIKDLLTSTISDIYERLKTDCSIGNWQQNPNNSFIKGLFTQADCYEDFVSTLSDTDIKELLTQTNSCIIQLLNPTNCSNKEGVEPQSTQAKESLTTDANIGDSLSGESSIYEILASPHADIQQLHLLTPSDASVIELLTTSDSSIKDVTLSDCSVKELLLPSYSCSSDLLSASDSRVYELLTKSDSIDKEVLSQSDSCSSDSVTPYYSSVIEQLTPSNSSANELITPPDSCSCDLISPPNSCVKEPLTQSDSSVRELLTPSDSCSNDLLYSSDASVRKVLTPSDCCVKDLLPPDSCSSELIYPSSVSVKDVSKLNNCRVKELLTPYDSCSSDLLYPYDSSVREVLTPSDSCITYWKSPNFNRDYKQDGDGNNVRAAEDANCHQNPILTEVLLIEAGDVELNPGPLESQNKTNDLKDIELVFLLEAIPEESHKVLLSILDDECAEYIERSQCSSFGYHFRLLDSLFGWKNTQKDDTDCRSVLAEKLTSIHLVAQRETLLAGGYSPEHKTLKRSNRAMEVGFSELELCTMAMEISPLSALKYTKLSILLGFSYFESRNLYLNFTRDNFEPVLNVLCQWKNKQKEGTDCRFLLAEKLLNLQMTDEGGRLLAGQYTPQQKRFPGVSWTTETADLKEIELVTMAERTTYPALLQLCLGLDYTYSEIRELLSKHQHEHREAFSEILCTWKGKQKGSADCRPLLADKLYSIGLQENAEHLLAGEYMPREKKHFDVQEISTDPTELTEREILSFTRHLPPEIYTKLCLMLGLTYRESQDLIFFHSRNTKEAMMDALCSWKSKQTEGVDCRSFLQHVLRSLDLGGLVEHLAYGKHPGKFASAESKFFESSDRKLGSREGILQETELLELAQDVPPSSYTDLCLVLDYTYAESQQILSRHSRDVAEGMKEVLFTWNNKQRDCTDCRSLLVDKLKSIDLPGLGQKLAAESSDGELGSREGILQETELLELTRDFPPSSYPRLCLVLDYTIAESQHILSRHFKDVTEATKEVLFTWNNKQKDCTDCRSLLVDKLNSMDLFGLGEKLAAGGYLTTEKKLSGGYLTTQKKLSEPWYDSQAIAPDDLSDKELEKLANEISPQRYAELCIILGFTYAESQSKLTKHLLDVTESIKEILIIWSTKHKGEGNLRLFLADKLHDNNMGHVARKLLEGGYLSQHLTSKAKGSCMKEVKPLTKEQIAHCTEDFKKSVKNRKSTTKMHSVDVEAVLEFEEVYMNLMLIRHDVETTTKTPLKYEDILSKTKVKRIMIQGEGGVGKTTLCKKMVSDWATETLFKDYEWVLDIPLRDATRERTVGHIAKEYLSDDNSAEADQIDQYIASNPEKVLLIFDGLDEYDSDLSSQDSYIGKILRSELLKNCTVIFTSRPWTVDGIRLDSDLQSAFEFLALEGFYREHVPQYITRYFKNDPKAANELIAFIESSDIIRENMTPFPIYISLLCLMWEDPAYDRRDRIKMFKTTSQLFREMINFLSEYYLTNQSTVDQAQGINMINDALKQIGQIAFLGILTKQLGFSEDVFDSSKEAMELCCKIGVLTREAGSVTHLCFPHKLFQEYVAAIHLASLYDSDRGEFDEAIEGIIKRNPKDFRFLLYFAVAQSSSAGLSIVKKLIEYHVPEDLIVDVAFESNDLDVGKTAGQSIFSGSKSLKLTEELTTHTVYGYAFILNKHGVEEICLRNRSYGQSLSLQLAEVIGASYSLRKLVFDNTKLEREFYSCLKGAKSSSVKELSFDDSVLRFLKEEEIDTEHLFPNLEKLELRTTRTISPEILQWLGHPNLKDLSIERSDHHLRVDSIVPLVGEPFSLGEILNQNYPVLKDFRLRGLLIGNKRAEMLLNALKNHGCVTSISILECFTDNRLRPSWETENIQVNLLHRPVKFVANR